MYVLPCYVLISRDLGTEKLSSKNKIKAKCSTLHHTKCRLMINYDE